MRDGGGIRAFLMLHDGHADTLAPYIELVDCRGPEGVCGAEDHLFPVTLELGGELANGRGFSGAVDAGNQGDLRPVGGVPNHVVIAGFECFHEQLFQCVNDAFGIDNAPVAHGRLELVEEFQRRVDAEVGLDENRFQFLDRICVELRASAQDAAHAADESRARLAETLLKFAEETGFLGHGIDP